MVTPAVNAFPCREELAYSLRRVVTFVHPLGSTFGFKCNSFDQLKQFHDVAVAYGGKSIEDPPGLRQGSLGAINLAYVRDPDGNKLCAIHRVEG